MFAVITTEEFKEIVKTKIPRSLTNIDQDVALFDKFLANFDQDDRKKFYLAGGFFFKYTPNIYSYLMPKIYDEFVHDQKMDLWFNGTLKELEVLFSKKFNNLPPETFSQKPKYNIMTSSCNDQRSESYQVVSVTTNLNNGDQIYSFNCLDVSDDKRLQCNAVACIVDNYDLDPCKIYMDSSHNIHVCEWFTKPLLTFDIQNEARFDRVLKLLMKGFIINSMCDLPRDNN